MRLQESGKKVHALSAILQMPTTTILMDIPIVLVVILFKPAKEVSNMTTTVRIASEVGGKASDPRDTDSSKQCVYTEICDRKIDVATAKLYGTMIKRGNLGEVTHHCYKYFDRNGTHIGNKIRGVKDKKFWSEGGLSKAGLFGEKCIYSEG